MHRTYGAAALPLLVFAGAAPAQLPTHPIEIEAHAVFRESFIAVMDKEPGEWQLQPTRARGPAPTGRPPLAHEEMTWRRRDNNDALVSVTYWRYSSSADAGLALQYHRELISVGTRDVKGLADEAFEPAGRRNVIFRRGSFVFEVRVRKPNTDPVPQPSAAITLSKAFLETADRALADADAR